VSGSTIETDDVTEGRSCKDLAVDEVAREDDGDAESNDDADDHGGAE
jgi:hypothetical protein